MKDMAILANGIGQAIIVICKNDTTESSSSLSQYRTYLEPSWEFGSDDNISSKSLDVKVSNIQSGLY